MPVLPIQFHIFLKGIDYFEKKERKEFTVCIIYFLLGKENLNFFFKLNISHAALEAIDTPFNAKRAGRGFKNGDGTIFRLFDTHDKF